MCTNRNFLCTTTAKKNVRANRTYHAQFVTAVVIFVWQLHQNLRTAAVCRVAS